MSAHPLPICERLRSETVIHDDSGKTMLVDMGEGPIEMPYGGKTVMRRNPDGPEAADLIDELYGALEFAEAQLDELINRHYGGDIPCTEEEAAGFEKIEAALAKARGEA
jgi:hypothetical protein